MSTEIARKNPSSRHSSRGFGSFELLWVLLVVLLFTVVIRLGGRLLGVEIGWASSVLFGVMTLVVLMMIVGIIASIREPTPDDARSQERAATPVIHEPTKVSQSERRHEKDACVRVFYDEHRKRRVRRLVRRTGTFYFQEEYVREEASEWFWIPVGGAAVGSYDSEETAIREARASIDWLPAP